MKQETITAEFETQENHLTENLYLTFTLGNQLFGADVKVVKEIIGLQEITGVPDSEESCLRGVINLRGSVIPILDLKKQFLMETHVDDDRSCIIIMHSNGWNAGFLVDGVRDVLDIPEDRIADASTIMNGALPESTTGFGQVGDDLVNLINIPSILNQTKIA